MHFNAIIILALASLVLSPLANGRAIHQKRQPTDPTNFASDSDIKVSQPNHRRAKRFTYFGGLGDHDLEVMNHEVEKLYHDGVVKKPLAERMRMILRRRRMQRIREAWENRKSMNNVLASIKAFDDDDSKSENSQQAVEVKKTNENISLENRNEQQVTGDQNILRKKRNRVVTDDDDYDDDDEAMITPEMLKNIENMENNILNKMTRNIKKKAAAKRLYWRLDTKDQK